jgi:cystathionine beta-lyase
MNDKTVKKETYAVHAGMKPRENHGIPNIPVYHTSTIMKDTLDDYRNRRGTYDYGRIGTPTSEAVELSVAGLYGSEDAVAVPSGLAAITTGVLAVVKSGDEVLFPDSLYGSGRRFAEVILPQIGVTPQFYNPVADAESVAGLITSKTSLLYSETPGSLTFEMQDTVGLVALAKEKGLLTACDNTWGTPFYFNAVKHGIDVIIEAGTKYISGHSDVSIGFVASSGETAKRIREYAKNIGLCVAPDDHYLTMRGLRTMGLRLRQSEKNGLALAKWLEQQPEVATMLHPALESHPQHAWWKRDFTGACGLFGFVIYKNVPDKAVDAMADGLEFFGIGASWGGHESLISEGHLKRSVTSLPQGRLMRIYAGLEDTDDLLADLAAGFERMRNST